VRPVDENRLPDDLRNISVERLVRPERRCSDRACRPIIDLDLDQLVSVEELSELVPEPIRKPCIANVRGRLESVAERTEVAALLAGSLGTGCRDDLPSAHAARPRF
jgi:hypothetical protein